jgi:site-specific DNA-methyltransferase (adenine-specific)
MDCLEGMKLIGDASVDMVLCDLPYGTTVCAWDAVIPFDALWEQYRRIIKPYGAIVLTATQPFTTTLIASNMAWYKYCWVWEKNRVGGIFNAKNMPLKSHEDIAVFSSGTTANGSDKLMPYYPQGLIETNRVGSNRKRSGKDTIGNRPSRSGQYVQTATGYPRTVLRFDSECGLHPTQKPVPLFEYLIRTYTNPGELVLDNCMGSGTTAIACINTGREYVGFELDSDYYGKAQERISNHRQETISVVLPSMIPPSKVASLDSLFE